MARNLTMAFMDMPCWYVLVGLVVSAYHGYRGYVVQRWTARTQKYDKEQKCPNNFKWFMSEAETIVVRYVYDALFYFFCSIAGFAALWLAASVFNALPNIHEIQGGTGALVAFLAVLGLLGAGGILPYVIHLGKIPT